MRRAGAIACGMLVLAGASSVWLATDRGPSTGAPEAAPAAPVVPLPSIRMPDPPHGRGATTAIPPSSPSPLLEEVRVALAESYYRYVPEHVLSLTSVELMLASLDDPYTDYLEPEEYEKLRRELSESYYGVGLTVNPAVGGLIVTSSLEGPAREAGIKPGDVIIRIDGHAAADLPFERSAALIKGEEGTVVHLTVERPGSAKPIEFTVVRREIAQPAVRTRLLRSAGHVVGYIRLVSFREDVATRVAAAATRLAERGAEGFILDLRSDPGGLLSQAIEVTSVFLGEGRVCLTSSLHETRSYFVSGATVEEERPLVVLVDGATASAAEIVAAALAENERATLIGRRTYGKASVQTLMELSNGGALRLTTATYLTPSGKSIRDRGLRPHVKAADDPVTRRDEAIVTATAALVGQI